MPEIQPTGAPNPRAVLGWDGTTWRVIRVDLGGAVYVNAVALLGLENTLQSVALDRLQVRGQDQLLSIDAKLRQWVQSVPSGAGGYIETGAVPAGEYWVVTSIGVRDTATPLTAVLFYPWSDGQNMVVKHEVAAIAANIWTTWDGFIVLDDGDRIRCYLTGALAADLCQLSVMGYVMTVEV